MILDPTEVESIRRRYTGTQLAELAESHERLRAMLSEAMERIAEQAELLGKKSVDNRPPAVTMRFV